MSIEQKFNAILNKFPKSSVIRYFTGANLIYDNIEDWLRLSGSGVLLITTSDLYFEYLMPKNKNIIIPLKTINDVEITKRFSEESMGRTVLKVEYVDRNNITSYIGLLLAKIYDCYRLICLKKGF